jgi:hypothetical protein
MTNLELEAGMRALVRTLAPDGPLLPGAARVVDALQCHLGTHHDVVHLAPIDVASLRGYFDPAHVLAAIARGAELNIDLTARWDYWTDLAAPLETVRCRYNVPPRIPRTATRAA